MAFLSCRHGSGKNSVVPQPGSNEMADLNRYMVRKDRERIQNYIERKNLRMTETTDRTLVSDPEGGRRGDLQGEGQDNNGL